MNVIAYTIPLLKSHLSIVITEVITDIEVVIDIVIVTATITLLLLTLISPTA